MPRNVSIVFCAVHHSSFLNVIWEKNQLAKTALPQAEVSMAAAVMIAIQ